MRFEKIIGWYQIIGGVFGGIVALNQFIQAELNLQQNIMMLFFLACYIMVIISGVLLTKRRKTGYYLSFLSQLLQLFNFAISNFAFAFCAGTYLVVKFSSKVVMNFVVIYSQHELLIGVQEEYLIVNLIPLFIITILWNKVFQGRVEFD